MIRLDRNVSEQNDTMETVRAWLRDSHLLTRTGAGAAVAALGLATATPPSDAAFGLAALLALAGAVIRFWAAGIISKNRELATTGPYAYVRNPLYTGSMLIAIAFLFLNGNPWFVIPAMIGAIVLYMRTIESEEADLRELFGADFERYREQVPAIIPWKGRVDTGGAPVTYSLEQSLFNKEFNGIAGTLGMLALFYLYAHWIDEGTFRVTTTLAVILLMAVRGSRRAAKERALAEQAAAEQRQAQENVPADEPESPSANASTETSPDAPASTAKSQPVTTPSATAAVVADAITDDSPADPPPEAPETAPASDSVDPVDLPVDPEPSARPRQEDDPVSEASTEASTAPEADTAEASPPVSDDNLPEPDLHAEITEAELSKLVEADPTTEPAESQNAAPSATLDPADPLADKTDDQRALLDEIDADEVADALGALELLDEDDDRRTETLDR